MSPRPAIGVPAPVPELTAKPDDGGLLRIVGREHRHLAGVEHRDRLVRHPQHGGEVGVQDGPGLLGVPDEPGREGELPGQRLHGGLLLRAGEEERKEGQEGEVAVALHSLGNMTAAPCSEAAVK